MPRTLPPGRPKGARSFDVEVARAFGEAVRARRLKAGHSQEQMASWAKIERAHVGRIERGEHLPTVVAVFKLSHALGCSVSRLMADVEALLQPGHIARLVEGK